LADNQASPLPDDPKHLHLKFDWLKTTLSNVTRILPLEYFQKQNPNVKDIGSDSARSAVVRWLENIL